MRLKSAIFFVCALFFVRAVCAQNMDPLKADIYSKISDLHCPHSNLMKCNCPEARAMKAYIEAFLETGASKEDVFYRVAKKYSLKVINDPVMSDMVEKRLMEETGGKYSRISFEPAALDFGKADRKQSLSSMVVGLYNKGTSDLIITNVRVSCGCVSASLRVGEVSSPYFGVQGAGPGWQVKIPPGKHGVLEVRLDLMHSSIGVGLQTRSVFVSSNDPLNPEATINLKIEIKE